MAHQEEMNVLQFIADLKKRGVTLWLEDGGKLRYRAREGVMTPALRERIKARKPEVVAALADAYRALSPAAPALTPAPPGTRPVLAPAQERLWFMEQLEPDSPVYLLPDANALLGDLDAAALEEAARRVILRHQSLRAGFVDQDGKPAIQIHRQPPWSMTVVDLTALPSEQRAEACRRLTGAAAARPFRLGRPPLFRAILFRLGPRRHTLCQVVHHLVADGWSLLILDREWRAAYRALALGREPAATPAPPRYTDYAHWLRRSADRIETQLAYWRERLAGMAALEFPTDRPRPPVQSYRGASVSFRFPDHALQHLKRLANEEEATLFMALTAAFAFLLQRYTGQNDLALGTSTGARPHPALENAIGLFVNLLTLRIDASGDPSFRELLARVRRVALEAYEHQDAPFERVVDYCGFERDLSRHPLFQVQLVFTGMPPDKAPMPGLTASFYDWGGVAGSRQDLTLGFIEHEGLLRGGVEYNVDLFERDAIERMTGHLLTLVDCVAANPDVRISRATLLTERELTQLARWNDVARPFPRALTLHRAFEAQAERAPDRIALTHDEARLRYGELNRRANQLAHRLRAGGVGPDRPVGVCLGSGPELAIAILATLKAGGAYVPLDHDYPQERLAFMLEDTELTTLIADAQGEMALPAFELNFIDVIHPGDAALADLPAENPDAPVDADNLANIIYTSGSTGRPKGVQVTHRNIMRLIYDRDYIAFGPEDRMAQLSNISFDALNFELWTALIWGGRLCIANRADALDPDRFAAWLQREGVGVAFITTALFHQFVRENPRLFASLDLLGVGGDKMTPAAPRAVLDSGAPPRELMHFYGPTESATFALWRPIDAGAARRRRVPIGRPIANTPVHALDDALNPVPAGVTGEAFIGGEGLARGYLKRPAQTAWRFIPDPFGGRGARLYRTGDLVRRLPSGEIEFLRRRDFQVKIRGFRIEPGEIETALAKHPKVGQSVVLAVKDDRGERLAAYVAPKLETPTPAELRQHLKEALPDYMIPAAFVILSAFPLTPNGKVDRKRLPTANPEERVIEKGYVPPVTETEKVMADIWREVLGAGRVGLNDNFFELGGDSLLSIQIKSKAQRAGLHFELHSLFEKPTIAGLLERAGAATGMQQPAMARPFELIAADDRERLDEAEIEDAYPLSKLQLGLLFHSAYEERPGFYHVALLYRVKLHFDETALRKALDQATGRHDILRASIDLNRFSQPMLLVWRKAAIPLEISDIRGVRDPGKFLARWLEEDKRRAFDWSRPPVFRVAAFREGSEGFYLAVSFHHAILDGWSDAALFAELMQRYAASLEGRALPADALTARYRDFVLLERQALEDDAALQFWDRFLEDRPVCRAPRWPEASLSGGGEQKIELIPVSDFVSQRLYEVAAMAEAPLKTALLAVHLKAMSDLYGCSDLVTGLGVNGRPEIEDGDKILGLFVNTLPFRVRLRDGSWLDLIEQAFNLEKSVMPYRRVPLSEIVNRHGRETPFDAVFNFTRFHVLEKLDEAGLGDLAVECGAMAETNFTLLFNLSVKPGDDRVQAALVYDANAIAPRQASAIAAHYAAALETMALTPQEPHSRKTLLTDEEQRLLRLWNQTADETPAPLFHRLFETFAEWGGRTEALQWGRQSLSYAELNARANRLARFLRRRGARLDAPVGVFLPQGPAATTAALAIWKAGAVYLPLAVDLPRERLRNMLADAAPALVIADRETAGQLPRFDGAWLDPELHEEAIAALPGKDLDIDPPPKSGAYLIFTSGSTGRPKGALTAHRGLANHVAAARLTFELGPGRRVVQFSSLSFDASISEMAMTLGSGATLCLANRAELAPGPDLARFLRERGVHVLTIPPSSLAVMPNAPLPQLDTLIVAGEACSAELAAKWALDRKLHNNYGPTETAIWATHALCTGGKPPIGAPIRNVRAYVVGPFFQPSPIGAPGELCLAGHGLARGYVGRPELTAERFVPNPFEEKVGGRLYRTGDQVRWLPEGQLDFIGRFDFQVKIRGFRIELGEIEAALESHPRVSQAAAIVAPRAAGGDPRLAAYVVFDGEPAPFGELRAFLARLLPDYMLPDGFIALDAMPRSRSGKIDRRALPSPSEDALLARRAYAAPATPTEGRLARIWGEVLDLDKIGSDDHFFDLGGHSLLATQVVSRVRDAFGLALPVKALFRNPVLSKLAARIDDLLLAAVPDDVDPPLAPRPAEEPPPLSFAQERMWFIDRLEPDAVSYNMPLAFRLHGPLDPRALTGAFEALARRHEALRARFPSQDGRPRQKIDPPESWCPLWLDLSRLSAAGAHQEAGRLANREAARPFSLARGPLFRVFVARLNAADHCVSINTHHIVSDGWSTKIVLEEFAVLYRAYAAGLPPQLPPPPLQAADYAYWQRRRLTGAYLEKQLAFWERRLRGAPPQIDLAVDRPRPAIQTYAGATHDFQLPSELSEAATHLCRQEGATPFMVFLAAYAALLARHSGQETVCVGVPIAGRDRSQIERAVGFFANTLVMRVDLTGDPGFTALVDHVRRGALDAYAHQDVPFEQVVERLKPERNLRRSPLFQVLFSMENTGLANSAAALDLPLLDMRAMPNAFNVAKFELSLYLAQVKGVFVGSVEYNADLFAPESAARFADHFRNLLEDGLWRPREPVSRLRLMDEAERRRLVFDWRGAEMPPPPATGLHQWFERRAAEAPQKTAIVWQGDETSYGALNARANRLARALRGLGAGPETVVAVCLRRGDALVAALLAALKTGAAYLPIDPDMPGERMAAAIEDADARLLISHSALTDHLPDTRARSFFWDKESIRLKKQAATNLDVAIHPESRAYILFTSGSTGRPKGVAVPHRAALALVDWALRRFPPEQLSGVMAGTYVGFDLSVFELFVPLAAGGAIHLAETALDPPEGPITLLNTVPSVARELVHSGRLPATVRAVNLAGEALPGDLARELYRRPHIEAVYNLYGPTEDATYSTVGLVPRDDRMPPAIGRPIDNTAAYLVDGSLELAPLSCPGEIALAGMGLARGYVGQPAMTAAVFVPDPFGSNRGGRLYLTGDVARWRIDGALQFLGRRDGQVKLRGFRIELGEIEAILRRQPGVREAAVALASRPDAPDVLQLAAYLVSQEHARADAEDLRFALGRYLPDYMIPAFFVHLSQLPRTAGGKLDRKALPAPALDSDERRYTPPRTVTERDLAAIWQEALGVARVGAHDNFFELGGHSLLAARVAARADCRFRVSLPLSALFAAPTIAGLAKTIERLRLTGQGEAPLLTAAGDTASPELSLAQERLWFLHQLEGASSVYNMPLLARARGPLAPDVFARALAEVAKRHRILLAGFSERQGRPEVLVDPVHAPRPVLIDLGGLPASERDLQAHRLARSAAAKPFALERPPLARVALMRLDDENHLLAVVMHHIITDGWSLSVLLKELSAHYEAFVEGHGSPMAERELQYFDYASWQRRLLSSKRMRELIDGWRRDLTPLPPPLALPTDRARPLEQTYAGASLDGELDPPLTESLTALARMEHCSLFMAVTAGFAALLARHSGQEDIVVGAPIAGRNHYQLEDMIGFFINSLPLRVDLSGDPSFRQLLGRARQTTLAAYDRQELPFAKLVEALQPVRDPSRNPVFQVFLNMLNTPELELKLGPLELEPLAPPDIGSKFELTLYVHERGGALGLSLHYNADLFNRERMFAFMDQFQSLLARAVKEPDLPLSAHSLLTLRQRPHLPNPAEPLPRDAPQRTAVELAAARAVRAPRRPALAGTFVWTYEQLNRGANRLAHWLQAHGVGRGARVAIYAAREPALALAMLAAHKAGAAFVILDSAHPAARHLDILRQVQPQAWLQTAGAGEPEANLSAALDADLARLTLASDPQRVQEALTAFAPTTPAAGPSVDDPAYIAFTSGTTGEPRGVLGDHAPLSHFVQWQARAFSLDEHDRFAMLAGLSHDPLLRDLFTPLALGAALHIPAPEVMAEPAALAAWLRERRVTVVHLTPPLSRFIAAAIASGDAPAFPDLRLVCFGGDILRRVDAARFAQLAPNATLVNFYGATETPQAVSWHRLPPADPSRQPLDAGALTETLPLGRGVPGFELLVRNAAGVQAAIGELGEIAVRSRYLARGYWRRDDLTTQSFIPNPEGDYPEDRLYLTGDWGRYLPDGSVAFAGRRDRQVKVRGYRVELEEIERLLRRRVDVGAAAVIAREERQEARLLAYVAPAGDATPSAAFGRALRQWLRRRLPDYMLPAAIVPLAVLPLTPNGKLDLAALPEPDALDADRELTPPRTATEEILAGIWQETLGLRQIDALASFFEIGGHSLLGVQVMARIRDSFSVNLPLKTLFAAPTVAELGRRVDAALQAGHGFDGPIGPAPREPRGPDPDSGLPPHARPEIPLSYEQIRPWKLERDLGPNAVYNLPYAMRVAGPLDAVALEAAFADIIRRHEVLRARYGSWKGAPLVVIPPPGPLALPVVDLRGLADPDRTAHDLAKREARRPFSLAKGPLIRLSLFLTGEDRALFAFTLHHIVSDGWSTGVLLAEWRALYRAHACDAPARLQPLPIQYADFAHWQRRKLRGPAMAELRDFWRERLQGAPPLLELPTDRPRPAKRSYAGALFGFLIDRETGDGLQKLGASRQATLHMTMLAAYLALLRRYSGQRDLLVGVLSANRQRKETEPLIGLFVSLLLMRFDAGGDPTFLELLARVRGAALDFYAHQDMPFPLAMEAADRQSHPSYGAFQTIFSLQNLPETRFHLPGLQLEPLNLASDTAKVDLTLTVSKTSKGLYAEFEYNTDLFNLARIAKMADRYDRLLRAILVDPRQSLAALEETPEQS